LLLEFTIVGRPLVQKNNLEIRKKRKKGGGYVSFIDHSSKMKKRRDDISVEIYKKYKKEGYKDPIDYFIEVDFVCYVEKRGEPDVDNLPSIFLDAMQGIKQTIKGTTKKIRLAQTLVDDKLVRKISVTKIVKGDKEYHGEPRAEITIRDYC